MTKSNQITFTDPAYKYYDADKRAKLLFLIDNGEASHKELRNIVIDYSNHLSKSHGVPDNYVGYHPDVIEAVKRNYPKLIEDIDNDTFVRKKKHQMFSVVAEKLYNGDINPMILKMYLEYLEPSADVEKGFGDIVFKLVRGEPAGSVTEPEEKK